MGMAWGLCRDPPRFDRSSHPRLGSIGSRDTAETGDMTQVQGNLWTMSDGEVPRGVDHVVSKSEELAARFERHVPGSDGIRDATALRALQSAFVLRARPIEASPRRLRRRGPRVILGPRLEPLLALPAKRHGSGIEGSNRPRPAESGYCCV